MKTLIIPDLHGKTVWKDAIEQLSPDRIVFTGDYVDDFPPTTDEQIIINLQEIITHKKTYPDKIELLWGNHDLMYYFLKPIRVYQGSRISKFHCTGFRYSYCDIIKWILQENKDLFKIATEVDGFLCTHAGLSKGWYKYELHKLFKEEYKSKKGNKDIKVLVNLINKQFDSTPHTFATISYLRGGDKSYGSPIWADLSEKRVDMPQIFGHSKNYKDKLVINDNKCKNLQIAVDILDRKNQFLVINDGNIEEHVLS